MNWWLQKQEASTVSIFIITKDDFSSTEGSLLPGDKTVLGGADFVDSDEHTHSVNEVVENVLNLVPESTDEVTTMHHDMLIKLKDKIAQGKHWIKDYKMGL